MLKAASWRRSRGQSGDTIVEVMIVLAVLGLAIGISYATANRSLLNARQAQEASLATEVVQSQVELLQTLAGGGSIYNNQTFCVTGTGSSAAVFPLTNTQAANPPDSLPSNCMLAEANRYGVTITWSGATGNPLNPTTDALDKFTVKASWDDVEGQGVDTATLVERIHQTP